MTDTTIAHTIATALECDYNTDAALAQATRHLYSTTNFQDVAKKYEDINDSALKYLNVANWLPKHLYLARALNLHRTKGLKIWDLGCGPGWFSWLAQTLGHQAHGIDLPGAPDVYDALCTLLDVPVTHHRIEPFEPLPGHEKHDVIILLMASFYIHNTAWNAKAWDYFLSDLDARLNPDGVVLFELNNTFGYLYTIEVFDVFVKHGYKISRKFCIKDTRPDTEQRNRTFAAISREIMPNNSPFIEAWRYISNGTPAQCSQRYLEQIEKDHPQAVDIVAHKGLLASLEGNQAEAQALLGRAAALSPDCVGYAVAYCQLLLLCGDRLAALRHIAAMCRRKPDSVILQAWLMLVSADEQTPLASISPYWKNAVTSLAQNSLFAVMCAQQPMLAEQKNPVEWYLRFGAMALGYHGGFTPLLYWGLHHDVLLSGIDPLLHYIMFGEAERREY